MTEQQTLDLDALSGVTNLSLRSSVRTDEITDKISEMFDYKFDGETEETISFPQFPKEFEIGLIVGSSGSGKSTILRERFGEEETVEWDDDKAIASHFADFDEAQNKFGAVGLNSIPTWTKPYKVLSNGERFRADMARKLKDGAVIDEFTSVVNRETAISCSVSISKYIRKHGLKNIVFASCHDDIIPYLQPSWIYNTDTHELTDGRSVSRPQIEVTVSACDKTLWHQFKKYHYLDSDLNGASTCYVATINDVPVAFVAMLTLMGRDVKHAWREHRVVVHPDFQGMGIGSKLCDMLGQAYVDKGCQYFSKFANPRMLSHREGNPNWRPTVNNNKKRPSYIKKDGTVDGNKRYRMREELVRIHAERVCYSYEYVGDGTKHPYTYEEPFNKEKEEYIQFSLFD